MSSQRPPNPKGWRTFVDRGGTFTDVVKVSPHGKVSFGKVRSDRAIVGHLAEGDLVFGTTVATNALLEGEGLPCLLIVSEGFSDLVHIGDMSRPDLFDAFKRRPRPLCEDVLEIPGRVAADGTVRTEIPGAFLEQLQGMDFSAYQSVAIALLNSHQNPCHEQAVAACLPDALHVCLGHLLSPEVDYLARIETTLVDAAITPLLLDAMARDQIPHDALAMRSDGSLCEAAELRAPDAVLSGPAGGVLAVEAVAQQAGFECAVGLDMGGTSTDVCRVEVGTLPRREGGHCVGGQRIRRPVLEVETIAAGGGSILTNNGFQLGVGPASAGANPGPACYGQNGPATLTDAALAMGLIDPDSFDPPLIRGLDVIPGEPEHFLQIAREAMAAAVRRLAVARGVSLEDHALVSYGGAAGQHAVEVAQLLGIRTVLVHPCASVLSAFGQALARKEEQALVSIWADLSEVREQLPVVVERLLADLPNWEERQTVIALRYRGTDHFLEIDWDPVEALEERFLDEHQRRFGFVRSGMTLEVVHVRVRVLGPKPTLQVDFEDPFSVGKDVVEGPCLLSSDTTSVWIPPHWAARMDRGLLYIEERFQQERVDTLKRSPEGVALWGNRLMSVAEQSGEMLRRLGRSVNIRERLDFSCAVFDSQGRLIANAPHIPVHLGAMGETVRELLRLHPDPPADQAWLSNDPAAGGSHLPDLTVVRCVHHEGYRFFVANRAHHVDVGGLTPGSMPPWSTSLSEEGLVFRHLPLLEDGRLRELGTLLAGCRDVESVTADLEAQIAANAHAAQALIALGSGESIDCWMKHLFDVSKLQVQALVSELESAEAVDVIGNVTIRLRMSCGDDRLVMDFSGTEGPHPGNLNAPRAVVRAAVLYALRCLVGRDFPLNEGALEPVEIRLPLESILSPPPDAAIVGGNVETSQRITDLVLRVARAQAGSQGTMNNLTIGGAGWAYYETLGGGSGAGEKGDGVSAVQVHMTNTRATDPEVLEARLPLAVRQMAVRKSSGGDGLHRGGDGLTRELELLECATVSLLCTRRKMGAPGLLGGATGLPGEDFVFRKGEWKTWDGETLAMEPGDRVRVCTPGGGGWKLADS